MWPWQKKLPAGPTALDYRIEALAGEIRRALAACAKPEPPPFVCVLVEATGHKGPTSIGGVGKLNATSGCIEIQLETQYPLSDCRVTVFADLARVQIHGLFLGPDCVTAAMGSCPVAFFKEWPLGRKLIVQAMERTERT